MSLRRHRKLLALLCVAILVFAVFAPSAAGHDTLAFLTPVWLIFQPALTVVSTLESTSSREQPVSLLSLGASRAPPAAPSL